MPIHLVERGIKCSVHLTLWVGICQATVLVFGIVVSAMPLAYQYNGLIPLMEWKGALLSVHLF
jgi:hypothetical protein